MIKHEYAPDTSAVDRTDGPPVACVVCGMPKRNRVHKDAPRDEFSARKIGEGETNVDTE